jgi:uncharacterized membrane protein HdeD (DUF308 family)
METDVARHWWAFALRGLAAIIFGVLAFVVPFITLGALVLLWGAYALVDGLFSLVAFFRTRHDHRWGLLLEGITGIAAGILAFVWTDITALVLLFLIAAWALITGVLEVIAAVRLRKVIANEWWLILSGILSILFAVVLIVSPGTGALALIWVIGAYAIIFGVMMLALALRLHGLGSRRREALGTA